MSLLVEAPRTKYFFDKKYQPILVQDTRGNIRKIDSKSLESVFPQREEEGFDQFIDFLE